MRLLIVLFTCIASLLPISANAQPLQYKLESYILRDRIVLTNKIEPRKAIYVAFSSSSTAMGRPIRVEAALLGDNKVLSDDVTFIEPPAHGNFVFDLPQKIPEGSLVLKLRWHSRDHQPGEQVFKLDRRLLKSSWSMSKLPHPNSIKWKPVEVPPVIPVKLKIPYGSKLKIYQQSPLKYFESNRMHKKELDGIDLNVVRNEYENISLIITPPGETREIYWSVSDLVNKSGSAKISDIQLSRVEYVEDSVGVRNGEYRILPRLIRPTNRATHNNHDPVRLWLTIKIGSTLPPGTYKGSLSVRSARATRNIPISVKVNPATLEDIPGVDYSMLMTYEFYDLAFPKSKSKPRMIIRSAENTLQDYQSHGMTTFFPHSFFVPTYGEGGEMRFDDLYAALKTMKKLGYKRPLFWYMGHLIQTAKPRHPGNITGFNRKIHMERLKKIVGDVQRYTRQHGLPEVVFVPIDEPEDSYQDYKGLRNDITPALLSSIRMLGAKSMVTAAKYKPFSDADYLLSYKYNERERILAQNDGKKYWLYRNDIAVSTRNPGLARYWYGLYTWKNKLDGMTTWTFQNTENTSGDPVLADNPGRDVFITYPHPDGPLSTLTWEAIREGIEDHKLIYQLEKRISRMRRLGLPTSRYNSYLNVLRRRKVTLPTKDSITTIQDIDFKSIRKNIISLISIADKQILFKKI